MARQMKDSGVEWIGVIPKDWSVSATKYLFKIQSGTTPDSKKEEFWDGDIRWVTPADFKTDDVYVERGRRNISDLGFASCGLQIIPSGSIIFSKRAPVGSVVISNADLSINQGCLACLNKGQSITKYYYYVMSIATEQYELRSSGTTFKEISAYTFSNFTLPLPPNDSQRVIADYIDAKSSLICNIIEQTRATIEEYKKLKQAIITEAVTKGVRGPRPMKPSGVEWIGDIPEEWSRQKIGNLATFFNGDRTKRYPQPSDFVEKGIPFINSTNLDNDELNITQCKYITSDKYNSLSGAKIKIKDIIICLRGSIGKCCINNIISEGTVASSLAVIRPRGVHSKYLLYCLLSDVAIKQTDVNMNGTCAANLAAESVAGYFIPVPLISEQHEIAAYLDAKCAEIDRIIEKKEQLIEEVGSYKKSLIYEYVTGKKEVTA